MKIDNLLQEFQQFLHMEHYQGLFLLKYYFHYRIHEEKTAIFKKRDFLGQTLVFLQLRKPSFYIPRL